MPMMADPGGIQWNPVSACIGRRQRIACIGTKAMAA
jgi:hypothetical protein